MSLSTFTLVRWFRCRLATRHFPLGHFLVNDVYFGVRASGARSASYFRHSVTCMVVRLSL